MRNVDDILPTKIKSPIKRKIVESLLDGRVWSQGALAIAVWGEEALPSGLSLSVHISQIREILPPGIRILTIRYSASRGDFGWQLDFYE